MYQSIVQTVRVSMSCSMVSSVMGHSAIGVTTQIVRGVFLSVSHLLPLQRRLNIDTLAFSWYLFPYTHNRTRRQKMLPACRTADETFAIPQFALTRSDIDSFMDELRGFHTAFRACFTRQEPRDQFFNYMVGQFSPLERKVDRTAGLARGRRQGPGDAAARQ